MHALFIDIETTGLHASSDDITVVAMASVDTSSHTVTSKTCLNMLRARDDGRGDAALLLQVCDALNQCDRIVAFNGKSFDLPFIAHKAGKTGAVYLDEWVGKLVDFCAYVVDVLGHRISMARMCEDNAIDVSKSATGKQAIVWAQERQHGPLEEYCMQDVLVLVALTARGAKDVLVVNPPAYAKRGRRAFRFRLDEAYAIRAEMAGEARARKRGAMELLT